MLNILYEDNELIVAVKPAGVSSQQEAGENMVTLLERHLRKKGEIGSIYLIHRLDRDVGGVMVYAKNHGAAGVIASAMEKRQTEKEYLAVVCGVPATESGDLKDYLWKDPAAKKTKVVDPSHKGAKEALLSYRLLETTDTENGPLSLVRIRLHTGRNHQIRVQFASRNLPLVGERKYSTLPDECNIALWSYRIALSHPVTGEHMEFCLEPPQVYPWTAVCARKGIMLWQIMNFFKRTVFLLYVFLILVLVLTASVKD